MTDLARDGRNGLREEQRQQVRIWSSGSTPILKAVAGFAKGFYISCEVSVEEYMACAVGGCAGCVVKVKTKEGEAMKRVCVDGPVFEASTVFA